MKKLNKILQTYNSVNLKLKEASFNASTCDLFTARADLKYAEKGANLKDAKLQYANLEYGANLTEADLDFAKTLLKIKKGI